ncbi:hypothetical protein SKAU_G00007300 [Synaphobranchus kaupii]|uniref:Uncharacterized protein n=1 Tax=Synaphobranchus kaupii TaxID=118154 RepID=A0A9Q1GB60_SYNKA|nr:hypothetical protein SKAU_G00007300 [Synaphobranchus kaupii]
MSNHSASSRGNYLCEVNNEVGQENCKYTLRAVQPINKTGIIVGAVIGALLLLLLLLFLIWLLYCLCHKRRYENEAANEIWGGHPGPKEPAKQPKFQLPLSRRGTAPHGIVYSSVRNGKWNGSERSSIYSAGGKAAPPTANNQGAPALKYDSRYGYPV